MLTQMLIHNKILPLSSYQFSFGKLGLYGRGRKVTAFFVPMIDFALPLAEDFTKKHLL